MIEKNKESQAQSLGELQQELKSLKALLLSRGPSLSNAPSSPLPVLGRPSIPAWQLASLSPANGTGAEPSSISSLNSSALVDSGEGKEAVDHAGSASS